MTIGVVVFVLLIFAAAVAGFGREEGDDNEAPLRERYPEVEE